jgi:hypothetical protein
LKIFLLQVSSSILFKRLYCLIISINNRIGLTKYQSSTCLRLRCLVWSPVWQGRANQYLIGGGGVLKNFPLTLQGPLKNLFLSGKCSRGEGGGGDVMFPKTKVIKIFRNTNFRPKFPRKFHNSPNKSLILQISQFQHARAPSPQVGPPFFWGGGG